MSGGSGSADLPYIGSKISLITTANIRYTGYLHTINTEDSTVKLENVQAHGTEGRPAPYSVPPSGEVYANVVFNGRDIKDLTVCDSEHSPTSRPGAATYSNRQQQQRNTEQPTWQQQSVYGNVAGPSSSSSGGGGGGMYQQQRGAGDGRPAAAAAAARPNEPRIMQLGGGNQGPLLHRDNAPASHHSTTTVSDAPYSHSPTAAGVTPAISRAGSANAQHPPMPQPQPQPQRPPPGYGGYANQAPDGPGPFAAAYGGRPVPPPPSYPSYPAPPAPFAFDQPAPAPGAGQPRVGAGMPGGEGGSDVPLFPVGELPAQPNIFTRTEMESKGEYDFERENLKFEQMRAKSDVKLEETNLPESRSASGSYVQSPPFPSSSAVAAAAAQNHASMYPHMGRGGQETVADVVGGYSKTSFFDTISCEASQRTRFPDSLRLDRNKERVLNVETFGPSAASLSVRPFSGYGYTSNRNYRPYGHQQPRGRYVYTLQTPQGIKRYGPPDLVDRANAADFRSQNAPPPGYGQRGPQSPTAGPFSQPHPAAAPAAAAGLTHFQSGGMN